MARTLRSLPPTLDARPIPYDPSRADAMQHDAFILYAAVNVLDKYGFFTYGTALRRIAAHVSVGNVDPIRPRPGNWGPADQE